MPRTLEEILIQQTGMTTKRCKTVAEKIAPYVKVIGAEEEEIKKKPVLETKDVIEPKSTTKKEKEDKKEG